MELLTYQEFGKLKIRHFFPEGTHLFFDPAGSTECAIGRAASEGLAGTYFAWRESEPGTTAEVALDFGHECPPDVGNRILQAINLPLRAGISLAETKELFGQPEFTKLTGEDQGFVRFVCGEPWPYYLGCRFMMRLGITGIIIFRKDYGDSMEADAG